MEPTNNTARLAGTLYVLMGLPAPFSLVYVPSKLIVRGDAAATANNILASETLFKAGIVAHLITTIGFILLALLLYRLLHRVNEMHASLMVIFVLVSIPISLFSVINEIAALTVLHSPGFLSVFTKSQLDALAMLFLNLRGTGLMITQIFWGLWLFPFGLLVMRSGFLPRILGVLLIVNGFAYPLTTLTWLLQPEYLGLVKRIVFIPQLGELWIMLWLLIKGAKVESMPAPALSAT